MKKVLSFIIALSLVMSSTIQSYAISEATTTSDKNENFDLLKLHDSQIQEDILAFESIGMDESLIADVEIVNNNMIYTMEFPNEVINYATIEETPAGDLVIDYYDNQYHNEVIITSDGKLYVDGSLIEFECKEYVDPQLLSQNAEASAAPSNITPRMRNADYSLSPFGSASNYTTYVKSFSGNAVSWGTSTAAGLVLGTMVTIICSAFNAGMLVSIGASIVSGLAASMLSYYQVYGMQDAFFSWKFDMYNRTDSMTIDRYSKYTGACFSRKDFQGTKYSHTYYEHNYFS
ncbi:MAG: hypothetical protein ACI3XD_04250 [Oscillospiraceae bacterium]